MRKQFKINFGTLDELKTFIRECNDFYNSELQGNKIYLPRIESLNVSLLEKDKKIADSNYSRFSEGGILIDGFSFIIENKFPFQIRLKFDVNNVSSEIATPLMTELDIQRIMLSRQVENKLVKEHVFIRLKDDFDLHVLINSKLGPDDEGFVVESSMIPKWAK